MTSKIKQRIARYCAYQERSHQEVRNKLYGFGLPKHEVEELIVELIQQDFLNEERFAKAYASGKFRYNHWGRLKIQRMLESKQISAYCIKAAMREIEDRDYQEKLEELTRAYLHKHRAMDPFQLKQRTARHLMSKGYEGDLVWSCINRVKDE